MSRDVLYLLLVVGGMIMGCGITLAWQAGVDEYRQRKQWFRPQSKAKPSERPRTPGHTPGGPQPTPRVIKGQRPSEGRHRAVVKQVRTGGQQRTRKAR